MPLANPPKTFGLDQSVYSKGNFPHLFNTQENQSYVGSLPDIRYFSPETRSAEDRDELLKWHKAMQKSRYDFDFRKEIYTYCSQGVSILRFV